MAATSSSDHWQKHASQWSHLGPPLRPCGQDVEIFESIAGLAPAKPTGCQALLLGVTPELALMNWPQGTRLLAIDRSPGMIAHVWPCRHRPKAMAILGNWHSPPLTAGSCNLILGDGCFTTLPFPAGYREVALALQKILAANGYLALRFFVRPDQPESLDQVLSDLRAERIGSFHVCKWRLAMSLPDASRAEGVRLDDIWRAWQEADYTPGSGMGPSWSPEAVATINNYRGVTTRYSFPSLEEIRQVFAPYFRAEACHYGTYELAERCPIMFFCPRL